MPKPCRLCSHPKADQIDKFVSDGTHSYKDFLQAFPELKHVHVSAWSRHRTDHMTATASEKEAQEFCSALSVKSLKKLNRSLLSCAKRAHQKGKTSDEITAYRQIAENQGKIRELEQAGAGGQEAPIIRVYFRDPAPREAEDVPDVIAPHAAERSSPDQQAQATPQNFEVWERLGKAAFA